MLSQILRNVDSGHVRSSYIMPYSLKSPFQGFCFALEDEGLASSREVHAERWKLNVVKWEVEDAICPLRSEVMYEPTRGGEEEIGDESITLLSKNPTNEGWRWWLGDTLFFFCGDLLSPESSVAVSSSSEGLKDWECGEPWHTDELECDIDLCGALVGILCIGITALIIDSSMDRAEVAWSILPTSQDWWPSWSTCHWKVVW